MGAASPPDPLVALYDSIDESTRLARGEGVVELLRTRELLRAALPDPPATVLDVGGGDGVHARWLADDGYDVEVIDVIPRHVELARSRGLAARVGDARSLDAPDGSVDVVLLLGPLYHLRERTERLEALAEARRVLRPGGLLAAAAVTRTAVALGWLRAGLLDRPGAETVVRRIAEVGVDDTQPGKAAFYFHTVAELDDELRAADFGDVRINGVEGPAWPLLDAIAPPAEPLLSHILQVARCADHDPSTAGASAHLLALARS